MPKVKLGTGKVVELVQEFGPRQELRAAELSGVVGEMDYAKTLTLNFASIMVAVKSIDGKTLEEVIGSGAVDDKEMLIRFREAFTKPEWEQLNVAFDKVYEDPKAIEEFEILP